VQRHPCSVLPFPYRSSPPLSRLGALLSIIRWCLRSLSSAFPSYPSSSSATIGKSRSSTSTLTALYAHVCLLSRGLIPLRRLLSKYYFNRPLFRFPFLACLAPFTRCGIVELYPLEFFPSPEIFTRCHPTLSSHYPSPLHIGEYPPIRATSPPPELPSYLRGSLPYIETLAAVSPSNSRRTESAVVPYTFPDRFTLTTPRPLPDARCPITSFHGSTPLCSERASRRPLCACVSHFGIIHRQVLWKVFYSPLPASCQSSKSPGPLRVPPPAEDRPPRDPKRGALKVGSQTTSHLLVWLTASVGFA